MSALLKPTPEPRRIVIDADEVAAIIGVSRKMVYEQAGAGALPCRRIGRRFLFYRPAIAAWLAGDEREPPQPDNDNAEGLNADQVAELLDVDRKTIYDAVSRREIPFRRLRTRIIFFRPTLVRWLWGCKATSRGQER